MQSVKNIGVLGCAKIISRSLIDPVKDIDKLQVYGIASRTRKKAEEYADQYNIPVVYDNYDELLKSKEIDFIYIALGNDLHAEWVLKCIENGKHVLIEKPLCLNAEQCKEIEAALSRSKVYLLEAVMVQHHPWQQAIKDIITNNAYGCLRKIKSKISFIPRESYDNNYRSFPEKGGGAFYDLSCYWLQFIQFIHNLNPVDFGGSSKFDGPRGCDWTFDASMSFKDNLTAEFICSFELPYNAYHILEFDDASIKINDFFRANLGKYKITINIDHYRKGVKDKIIFEPQNYYINQLLFFSDVIDGLKENIPVQQSFDRINLMEKIMQKTICKIQGR